MKKLFTSLLVLVLLTACGSKTEPEGEKTNYKIGVHGGDSLLAWKYVVEELKKDDITLEIVSFASYPEPNAALSSGEIDLNAFQHHAYFDQEVSDFNYDLSVLGFTYIAPLAAYSNSYKSIDEIKDNDRVLIPNDVSNGGRALVLLATNGLIKLKDTGGDLPTIKDIENPRNLDIIELVASNIPGSLDDTDFALINAGIAVDAGLNPKDAIFVESVDLSDIEPFKQYINLIAVRTSDLEDPVLKKILEIYQSDAVAELVDQESKGANIPVW